MKLSNNSVFNAAVCIIGILILLLHAVNLIVKKGKRKDERALLVFFAFTALHFATYLTFTIVKAYYTSDAFVTAFYTVFYVMNNIEVFLLFRYAQAYIDMGAKLSKAMTIVNYVLLGVFLLLDGINVPTHIFFGAQGGEYIRSNTMILSQGYQFVMFSAVFIIALTNKRLNLREKIAFGLYCLLPVVAIILQNFFKGYAIAYLSIIISIEVLFLFLSVQKNMQLAKVEEKNKDTTIKLMLSQIKPHFVYNSLSAISTLIPIDPPKAQAALDDFTEYLRMNLSSLTSSKLIPFGNELKHIETYVALEKMRFGDRVNVEYDVQTTDFELPPLTIQPIVENAIKHGILQRLEGGTLTLRTRETPDAVLVEIEDNGVGFVTSDVDYENDHFGLQNIKYRLSTMCKADLDIVSLPGQGTTVTVTIYK